jgi:hypothetical protein
VQIIDSIQNFGKFARQLLFIVIADLPVFRNQIVDKQKGIAEQLQWKKLLTALAYFYNSNFACLRVNV